MTAAKSLEIPARENPYAGKTYEYLASKFPLIEIIQEDDHKKAKEVFLKLIRYKKDFPDNTAEIAQINAYMGSLKLLIKAYEEATFQFTKPNATEVLQDLIDRHGLTQSDFETEIGKQPHVSRILKGQRDLNLTQIKALAKRFNVKTSTFV